MRGAVRRRGRMPPVAGSPWRLTAGAGLALTAVLFLLPLLTVRGEGGGAAGETENAPLTATAPEGQTTRAAGTGATSSSCSSRTARWRS